MAHMIECKRAMERPERSPHLLESFLVEREFGQQCDHLALQSHQVTSELDGGRVAQNLVLLDVCKHNRVCDVTIFISLTHLLRHSVLTLQSSCTLTSLVIFTTDHYVLVLLINTYSYFQ